MCWDAIKLFEKEAIADKLKIRKSIDVKNKKRKKHSSQHCEIALEIENEIELFIYASPSTVVDSTRFQTWTYFLEAKENTNQYTFEHLNNHNHSLTICFVLKPNLDCASQIKDKIRHIFFFKYQHTWITTVLAPLDDLRETPRSGSDMLGNPSED